MSAYENDRRSLSADVAVRYAEKYGVTTDWILREAAPKYREELSTDTEDDYSELMALFQKLGTGSLRIIAIEQLRVLSSITVFN